MVDIPTLTGEKIPLNLANEVIRPNTVKRIPGNINCFMNYIYKIISFSAQVMVFLCPKSPVKKETF